MQLKIVALTGFMANRRSWPTSLFTWVFITTVSWKTAIKNKMETLLGAEQARIDCDCRKRERKVSLPKSYGVGDGRPDVLAARGMGLRTMGMKTGHVCRDYGGHEQPDWLAYDPGEALDFIPEANPVEASEGVRT